mgnify:CR=1 FL=1
MKINEKLKIARLNLSLTQEEVADKIMISRQTISNWENGKSLPDIISIINLSELYQISLDELLKSDPKIKEKIKKDTNKAKNNANLILRTGILFLIVMAIYTISIFVGGAFNDFCRGAISFVLLGIGLAFVLTYFSSKE